MDEDIRLTDKAADNFDQMIGKADIDRLTLAMGAVCHELAAIRYSINAVEVELRRETGG